MARPRMNEGGRPVEERIREAFWDLLREKPIEKITVSEITQRARCNRGTFYYYFSDTYALFDETVEACLPAMLPAEMLEVFLSGRGAGDSPEVLCLVRSQRETIDRLCLLLNTSAAEAARRRVMDVAIQAWSENLDIDLEENDSESARDARLLFEFLVNGILGVLALRGRQGLKPDVETCFGILTPDVPAAVLGALHRCGAVDARGVVCSDHRAPLEASS